MRKTASWSQVAILMAVISAASGAVGAEPATEPAKSVRLFDGIVLGKFKAVEDGEFEAHGEVTVVDGALALAAGKPATGVRYAGEFPQGEYEIAVEARRAEGEDFFCGMTFPVGEKGSLTLILGGWGGWVTGLSCINGRYAIDNDTCSSVKFENGRWYKVRLRVAGGKVQAWVDDQQIVDFETADHELAASEEMQPCAPFGFATWNTRGELRNIEVKRLGIEEKP